MNPLHYIHCHRRWAIFTIANVVCLFSLAAWRLDHLRLKSKFSSAGVIVAAPLRSALPKIGAERGSSTETTKNVVHARSTTLLPAVDQHIEIALDALLGNLRLLPIDESGHFNGEFGRLLGLSEHEIQSVSHEVRSVIAHKQRAAPIQILDANACIIQKADIEAIRESLAQTTASCAIPDSHKRILTQAVLHSGFFVRYLFSDIHTHVSTNFDASVSLTVKYERIADGGVSTQSMEVIGEKNLLANPNVFRFQNNIGGRLLFGPQSFSIK